MHPSADLAAAITSRHVSRYRARFSGITRNHPATMSMQPEYSPGTPPGVRDQRKGDWVRRRSDRVLSHHFQRHQRDEELRMLDSTNFN